MSANPHSRYQTCIVEPHISTLVLAVELGAAMACYNYIELHPFPIRIGPDPPLCEGQAPPDYKQPSLVLSELQHFADAEWKSFGLKCGLHYNTLKAIERDAGSTKECFRECVACWLKRKDNVDTKGKPTLERLADIVEETGDNATAEEIRICNGIVKPPKLDLEFHQAVTMIYSSILYAPHSASDVMANTATTIQMPNVPVTQSHSEQKHDVASVIDDYASEIREKYNEILTKYKNPNNDKYPAAGPTAPDKAVVSFIPLNLIKVKSLQKKSRRRIFIPC
uniref:Death domain-containing protein n=1 Tax=Amphimedon queenslandica TaxID=400682 RepID=A0A1X7TIB3_AMPQE